MFFRLNIVLRDMYQVDEFVMKLRNGNKELQMTMSKALAKLYEVCWGHHLYHKETVS